MSRLGIFIADGCEEVEALTVVDIVRRAKLEIDMISINGTKHRLQPNSWMLLLTFALTGRQLHPTRW